MVNMIAAFRRVSDEPTGVAVRCHAACCGFPLCPKPAVRFSSPDTENLVTNDDFLLQQRHNKFATEAQQTYFPLRPR
jgi:hypothetical protein